MFDGQSNAGMVVDLACDPSFGRAHAMGYPTGTGQYDLGRVDCLVSIEHIDATIHADMLRGSSVANHLSCLDGNDVIQANGDDLITGGLAPIDLEEPLFVAASDNDVWLWANTAASGWAAIAVFNDVPAAVFDAGIEDGTMVSLIGTDFGF